MDDCSCFWARPRDKSVNAQRSHEHECYNSGKANGSTLSSYGGTGHAPHFTTRVTPIQQVKVTPSPACNDLQAGERVSRQQQSAEQQYNAPSNIDTQQQASRSIMNSIKTKMSSKGGREDLQDVDFHYITERIIAIAFPDGGLDSTYKASLREVTRMLQTKHDEKHMIFNLSERRYDIPKLNKHVMDFGWPDHLAPPLENLCSICKSIDSWLSSDPQHVAVLHCKGSTGRMGVVVASYMHYCNICASADNALDRFAMKRYYDNKLAFATHPSQRRYIQYFSGLLSGNIKMNNQPLYLHQVVIYGAPNFDLKGGCRPFIKVYQGMQPVYTSGVYMPSDGTNRITLAVDPVLQLRGDILVKCYHKTSRVASRDVIFCLQFHTCAVATDRLLLRKEELDGACIDSRFPDHGKVEVMLSSVPDRVFTDLDAIPVDTSMDALVRADSYENFNVHPEDGGEEEEITHTQGPVDGSLYAEVTKRKPASSATNEEVQNGPHVSMDSGISSSSGQTGQYNTTLQIAVTPKHSHVLANSNSNPPPLQRPDNAPSPKQGLNTAQASNLDALLNDMLESAGLDREQAEAESSKSYNQVYRLTTTTSSDKYSNGPSVTPSSPPKPPIRSTTTVDTLKDSYTKVSPKLTSPGASPPAPPRKYMSVGYKVDYNNPYEDYPHYRRLEGMSRGEGPAPGREDEQAHATWLLAQKQKLRARQEGKDWDEGTAKALVSELRDVQTRMRRSESDRQEREMFTDNQLLIETGGAAAASPPSQTSPYTASKPPIYQAPRLGSAPSSPMSRRANSPQQQQQPPPRAWQSHQRPLQRQHSDTSFDRDRDHPAVAPPVARTRAGSASQMSPPLSPGSERYYQNINQYAVPSTNTTERRQVDTSTLVYKQKIEDDMQALLDSLQETAQSARDESSLRREGVSSQYRSQRPVEMETPIASSSAQRAETQPVYAQPSQPFSSGQPTTPVVLTQDDIARKMSGLATEEPITREVAPRKSQAVRVLQPQPIRTAPVAAPLPTDMYDGHANQTTMERSSMSKRQQQQANSSSSHHQYQQQQQWSQQSQDRNQSMNRQEVNPREQSPFLEQTVVRQELPPQQHPREQQQPPPLREVYSPGYASQQQQQLPQQQQLQQQQQQQQQQQARGNQEYRFQQESRSVQHDQRSQRGYSPTKVDDLERGLQLAADRTGKGISIQSGNQQDGGFNDVITMTARLANDRSTTESLPRSVQAEVHAAPERAPPPERPPPPDRPETPSFPVTPATPYQNRRQLDTNTEQHVRMQQMAGGSQQFQHHTQQQQQQQHHTQQQHQDHTQQRHDQQFGVQQQISPIRLDMERDRPTTPAFPVMPATPYMNRGMSPVATHGGESMTTNRVEYSYGRTQRSYQSGQQEALRGGIATSPRSPPLMGGDRGTSPIRGEIVPGSQGSPGSFYQGGSRRSSISSVDTLEVIRHHPVFVKDVSSYWYKPDISREQAINMLKERPPGTFVVRDSNSFPGAFGLAVKVAQPPPNVQHKMGDVSNELVRHFLIEPTAKGVRLKGCANEPVFGSLSALVYQHSITALALPCKLIIPEIDPAVETASESEHGLPSTASALLAQGAACNVLYLSSYETESLTGPQAVRRAMGLLSLQGQIVPTVVHFKVSGQGITLTDNNRKLFFRRHYPVNTVTYCGMDPEDRRWTQPSRDTGMPMNAKCYGFIARKTGSKTDNACHLFAELDPDQPASAIVNFVSKVMIAHMNKV